MTLHITPHLIAFVTYIKKKKTVSENTETDEMLI